jgi:alpha-glucan,water dikinase
MMEEWHQKLHNNSSADDVAICQALLDYIGAGQQQQAYWDSLAGAGERHATVTADAGQAWGG